MKKIIKFKEWIEFDIRCGEIKEIKDDKVLVDICLKDLIICDKGNLEFNVEDKIIVLLNNKEGRILAVNNSLLTVDKEVSNGSKVS